MSNNNSLTTGSLSAGNSSEKVIVSVKKVCDAGIRQTTREGLALNLSGFTAGTVFPIKFVMIQNSSPSGNLLNLIVDRIAERPRAARIRADLVIPLSVTYTDAAGNTGFAVASLTQSHDVILNVPEPSIIPYAFEAIVSAVSQRGSISGGPTDAVAIVDMCLTTVLKIVIDADIAVHSYGYAQFPQLQDFVEDACSGYFDLPLYPRNNRNR